MLLRTISAILVLTGAYTFAASPSPTAFNVEWTAPSTGPGTTQGGKPTHKDSMPLGNGGLTVLAWNVLNISSSPSSSGVSFYVGHQNAMSSFTELFRMGQVDVLITPNPFTGGGSNPTTPYFWQYMDISTATMSLALGGSSNATYNVFLQVFVDANTDTVFVTAQSRDPSNVFNILVNVTSTRSSSVWHYTPSFGVCSPVSSQPDVFVDPVPSTSTSTSIPLIVPPPLTPQQAMYHASSHRRPSRTINPLPAYGTFMPGSIITYHRNQDSDGLTLNETLTQQGIASLLPTTPDFWRDNQFGFVLDSGAGPSLNRTSPSTLASTSPANYFELRVTVLAVQTNTSDEWIADLSALVTTRSGYGAAQARPAHNAFWSGFWDRSYIAVNMTSSSTVEIAQQDLAAEQVGFAHAVSATDASSSSSLPVPGASFWVRASSLSSSQTNNSVVTKWTDESGSGWDITQSTASRYPIFQVDAFGADSPGVVFDGIQTFLENVQGSNGGTSTMFAVFRDDGSSGGNTQCCSGVVYFQGGCNGISTTPGGGSADDDDQTPAAPGDPIYTIADSAGFSLDGNMNVRGVMVQVGVTYDDATTTIYVDGCNQGSAPRGGASGQGLMVGTRNNELGRYFKGAIGEVVVFPRVLNSTEIISMTTYFSTTYPTMPSKKKCRSAAGAGFQLSQQYAITRYVQAIQSRNVQWPIKFNGMAFIAATNDGNGQADGRDWGPSNWWQNTRLPYGAMLTSGDFDLFKVILDYYANAELLLGPRTQLYWNHSGMWTTETHHLSGAYDQSDYGCSRPEGYPVSIMTSGYLHVDQGGDSGTGEYPLMALDYFLWTNDATAFAPYLKIPVQAANYFMYHFLGNISSTGNVIVWPAQVLETWWCDWSNGAFENCCADDAPTISGMMTLFEKLLALPTSLTTPQQRADWRNFVDKLIPALPLSADGTTIIPAAVLSSGTHNDEGPELYAMHPHRVFTKGREVASNLNISIGVNTLQSSGFAHENSGWNYGLNAAALLGITETAATQVLQRAATGPASGYRFPGFAPHFQDFDPSADHFANMMRCTQDMLLQSGDDGFASTTIVLFPAWPCSWDVSAKLWGPLNTTVEIEYMNGTLQSLVVTPASRLGNVKWANCVVA